MNIFVCFYDSYNPKSVYNSAIAFALLVHKATHHFDLVNWFIDQEPLKVNAFGNRHFYGPTRNERSESCLTRPYKASCEFYFDIAADSANRTLYLECEDADGYYRDSCVFSEDIDIEDSVSVSVEYKKGAVISYSLTAHSPYECYRLAINGTRGRLEADNALGLKSPVCSTIPDRKFRIGILAVLRRGKGMAAQIPYFAMLCSNGYAMIPWDRTPIHAPGQCLSGSELPRISLCVKNASLIFRSFIGICFTMIKFKGCC